MEIVSGIKIRDIFLDNDNWWKFFLKNWKLIRVSIIVNILKLLVCRTALLGCHTYKCPKCFKTKVVPHSCKSRFCSSCGKKATDNWIKKTWNTLPRTTWQHITFTLPKDLMEIIWLNRHLMNLIPAIAAGIIKQLAKEKGILPGIFIAIHTFGRDIKRNYHLHLSTTVGGLSDDTDSWVKGTYFFHETLKKMWRYRIIKLLRDEYDKGNLKLPLKLKFVNFTKWTSKLYKITWVVHLNKQSKNMKNNIEYLGKYLKRPPIGETRIKEYNGKTVTYEYLDHRNDTVDTMTLPVLEFLGRLISHIPDKNFRNIRYFGFLSCRTRGKLLPKVYKLLNMNVNNKKIYISWRELIKKTFEYDPIECPNCKTEMILVSIKKSKNIHYITSLHEKIATKGFPLLE